MTFDEALTAAAAYLNAAGITGLDGGAHYPLPAVWPPGVSVVIESAGGPVTGGDEQTWRVEAWFDLSVSLVNESQYDIPKVDPVVTPIVDLFTPAHPDAHHLRAEDGDRVDYCRVDRWERLSREGRYGKRLVVDIKLRRSAA